MFTILKRVSRIALVACLVFTSSTALASGNATYHVTITNLTNAIVFTPILVASHRRPVGIFELGSPASDELSLIAEAGDTGPLATMLNANPHVIDVQSSGFLMPGQSITVIVSAAHGARHVSIASMMLPTNDGFIALDSVKVRRHGSVTYFSPGYDAGSELNDELCANIPGPPPTCSGMGHSPSADDEGNEGDEGYVYIHRGMHGIGDLAADVYDWRNPVAKITVTRVRGH